MTIKYNKLTIYLLFGALLFSHLLGCSDQRSSLMHVGNSNEEKESFMYISNNYKQYSVIFYDRQGNEIKHIDLPQEKKNLSKISIQFQDGLSLNHTLINPDNVYLLIGE